MTMGNGSYESLPEHSPVVAHLIAGASAGILEHAIMYPIDCVKVSAHEKDHRPCVSWVPGLSLNCMQVRTLFIL